jgi:hypothetical protein
MFDGLLEYEFLPGTAAELTVDDVIVTQPDNQAVLSFGFVVHRQDRDSPIPRTAAWLVRDGRQTPLVVLPEGNVRPPVGCDLLGCRILQVRRSGGGHSDPSQGSGRRIILCLLGSQDVLGPPDKAIFVEVAPKEQLPLCFLGDDEFDFGGDGLLGDLVLFHNSS